MKTVRVRIAVCVQPGGEWAACGVSGEQAEESSKDAARWFHNTKIPHAVVYIEADVPLPESVTVEGKVTS